MDMPLNFVTLLEGVKEASARAGEAILAIYADPSRFETEQKSDDSPLTAADLASNHILVRALKELTPRIPILSEESAQAPWSERQHWRACWVVDPLDGTKEFLKRNDEFTVNVGLVIDHVPVLGVVYAPALGQWYFAAQGQGAWEQKDKEASRPIQVSTRVTEAAWRVVGSRSHQSPEMAGFLERLGETQMVAMGSSLKLCLVASGEADVYPRLGPTSEWDTCAAHAIVNVAGGQVLSLETGEPLAYNARETILNPNFIVCTEPKPEWFGSNAH